MFHFAFFAHATLRKKNNKHFLRKKGLIFLKQVIVKKWEVFFRILDVKGIGIGIYNKFYNYGCRNIKDIFGLSNYTDRYHFDIREDRLFSQERDIHWSKNNRIYQIMFAYFKNCHCCIRCKKSKCLCCKSCLHYPCKCCRACSEYPCRCWYM